MANNYSRFFKKQKYAIAELIHNCSDIEKKYDKVSYVIKKGKVTVTILLQPSEGSPQYKVQLVAKTGSTKVEVFVREPNICEMKKTLKIPHLYPSGALCLYYPDYKERDPDDSWADTLVPWTCLWLYYFELWRATGEWMGGGIHPGDLKPKRN